MKKRVRVDIIQVSVLMTIPIATAKRIRKDGVLGRKERRRKKDEL